MEQKDLKDKNQRTVSIGLLLILLILFFILPISMEVYDDSPLNIFSVTWTLLYNPRTSGRTLILWQPSVWIIGIMASFLRLVFLLQIGRYFAGKTTRARTLALGLLAELQMALLYGGSLIYSTLVHGLAPSTFLLPTPIFLIIGWLFIRIHPPERHEQLSDWLDYEK